MLRNNEYYNIQQTFDSLYDKSKHGKTFNKLLNIIESEENIMLAYRNIKKNKGSKTQGINKKTIIDIAKENPKNLILYVRGRLKNYIPQEVRRVEIEKPNGGFRPLGMVIFSPT